MVKIVPVIMSGGAGTRLWPASRQNEPKQLLALTGEQSLVQQTASRFGADIFANPLIICNNSQQEQIASQLASINIRAGFITEPVARNTAACAVIAALAVQNMDANALMILTPADHFIKHGQKFTQVIKNTVPAANQGYIVTLGITATRAETGYGYIKKSNEKSGRIDADARKVAEFCEKPDLKTARKYLASGQYFWNAGIFIAKPSVLLEQMAKYRPDILSECEKCWQKSKNGQMSNTDITRLDKQSFAACPSESIDYALMEKTKMAAMVEADIGWSDIGSWSALHELIMKENGDKNGNAIKADVFVLDTKNSLIYSDEPFIATIGIDNLAIIAHKGAILISNMDKVQNVKQIVDYLKDKNKKDLL